MRDGQYGQCAMAGSERGDERPTLNIAPNFYLMHSAFPFPLFFLFICLFCLLFLFLRLCSTLSDDATTDYPMCSTSTLSVGNTSDYLLCSALLCSTLLYLAFSSSDTATDYVLCFSAHSRIVNALKLHDVLY
jgi:hypothetical protein